MGEISQAGDFYYSVPNFLGTERTGPNLGQIGGKRPTEWLMQHYMDPRSVSPGSLMPSFAFLSNDELNALVAYVGTLGTQDLSTGSFNPPLPVEYQYKTSPYAELFNEVASNYNASTQTYNGSSSTGIDWATIFDEGKMLYAEKGDVPKEDYTIPFGEAALRCEGTDATIIAIGGVLPKVMD